MFKQNIKYTGICDVKMSNKKIKAIIHILSNRHFKTKANKSNKYFITSVTISLCYHGTTLAISTTDISKYPLISNEIVLKHFLICYISNSVTLNY